MTEELRLERLFPVPPEKVFAAWTDPAAMSRWLSPTGRALVETDVRVGGRFRVVMLSDDVELEHRGEYLVVEPPTQLSFTWVSPYTGPSPSVVTVTLQPEPPGTGLVLVHRALPPEALESHRGGWGAILDGLATELGRTVGAAEA